MKASAFMRAPPLISLIEKATAQLMLPKRWNQAPLQNAWDGINVGDPQQFGPSA